MYAYLPLPDARKADPETYREDVAALARMIREQCPSQTGQTPNMGMLASLLGVSDSSLYAYIKPPKGRTKPTQPPFTLIYAMRALLASPKDTQAMLWGAHG